MDTDSTVRVNAIAIVEDTELRPEHTMRTKCAISDAFVPYCVIA